MFMDKKNQYSKNDSTTQSNLQIQCNPYQATNSVFHRTGTNNFTICMEMQKKKKKTSSLMAHTVKRLLTMPYTQVQSLGWEEPLEKEMATHSSTLAWKIPWTEEPGRIQSLRSQSWT